MGHLPGSVTRKRTPNSASLLVISVFRRDWCVTPSKSYKVTQVRSPCAPSCSLGCLRPTSELASSTSWCRLRNNWIDFSLTSLPTITTTAASWWHLSRRSPAATMKNSGVVHWILSLAVASAVSPYLPHRKDKSFRVVLYAKIRKPHSSRDAKLKSSLTACGRLGSSTKSLAWTLAAKMCDKL